METLTSLKASERVGVNVQKFHRLAAQHNVFPILKAPGLRGAKFWNPADIDRLVSDLAARQVAS